MSPTQTSAFSNPAVDPISTFERPPVEEVLSRAVQLLDLGKEGLSLLKEWFSPYRIHPPTSRHFPATRGDSQGSAKASALADLLEAYGQSLATRPLLSLNNPERVFLACQDFRGAPREVLRVFHLNSRQDLLRVTLGALGGPSRLHCTPADILSPVLALGVPKIILAHNHPSGDAAPSEEDLLFTRHLEEACHLLGVGLVDHLVVTESTFTSFRREGLL